MQIDGQAYPLQPGTCIAVEPHEEHEVRNTGTTELILTYFGLRVEATSEPIAV